MFVHYGRIMIRLTRRFAAMLQRAGSWRSVLAGFALAFLVAGVGSVCVTGHPDDGGRGLGGPATVAGHDDHERHGAGYEPSQGTADRAPHGGDHSHDCCARHVPPATDVAAQRPEEHQPPAAHVPVLADPLLLRPSQSPVYAGLAPPAPSLIQLSISRT